jgi:hypothetical protein
LVIHGSTKNGSIGYFSLTVGEVAYDDARVRS